MLILSPVVLRILPLILCLFLPTLGMVDGQKPVRSKPYRTAKEQVKEVSQVNDLPILPFSRSPYTHGWSNSVAICATMRDENVTDVVEWLQYYRWLGVDRVFLTDNNSSDAATATNLKQLFPSSFLYLRSEPQPHAQMQVYAWCAENLRHRYNWIAFFDLDEYLVFTGPEAAPRPRLKGFLDAYRYESGLAVNWVMVGPSGRETRVATGGVLRDYTHCLPEGDGHIKTIVNTWFLSGVSIHAHNFIFRGGGTPVTSDFHHIFNTWFQVPVVKLPQGDNSWSPAICEEAARRGELNETFHSHCFQAPAAMTRLINLEQVALFHFATKSLEDFHAKMRRGSSLNRSSKTIEYFKKVERNQKTDPLCELPSKLWASCCSTPGRQESLVSHLRAAVESRLGTVHMQHPPVRKPVNKQLVARAQGLGSSRAPSLTLLLLFNVALCAGVISGIIFLKGKLRRRLKIQSACSIVPESPSNRLSDFF